MAQNLVYLCMMCLIKLEETGELGDKRKSCRPKKPQLTTAGEQNLSHVLKKEENIVTQDVRDASNFHRIHLFIEASSEMLSAAVMKPRLGKRNMEKGSGLPHATRTGLKISSNGVEAHFRKWFSNS